MKRESDHTDIVPAAQAEIFETMRDGVLVLDAQSRVLTLNAAARRILGQPGAQAIGKVAIDLFAGQAKPDDLVCGETPTSTQVTLGANEAQGRYELTVSPLVDQAGKPAGQIITLCHLAGPKPAVPDASDQTVWNLSKPVKPSGGTQPLKRDVILEALSFAAEQFLKITNGEQVIWEALARLGQAASVSQVYVYENAPNQQAAVLTDLRRNWVAPQLFSQLGRLPTYQRELPFGPQGLTRWQELFSAGKPVYGCTSDFPEAEQKFLADRGIRSILVLPIFVGSRWWGLLGFEDDVVERHWHPTEIGSLQTAAALLGAALQLRQAFETIRESEARSRALVDAIPDTILRLTRDGKVIDFKSHDDFGQALSPEKIVGRSIREWLPPKVVPAMLDSIQLALDAKQPQAFEYLLPGADNVDLHYEARVVTSGKNEVVAIVRNVSERARLEQMKTDFIHRAAHDLRTPLTTASLAASIIQEGGTPEELEQYWKILRTELGRQRELIEELLTMGRLESGTFQLTMLPVEVGALLQEALEGVRPLAEKRQVSFQCAIAPDLPQITGDKNGLKQVFVNLCDNAVKFSPPGQKVELTAAAKADGVSICVRDHGMGIPAEDLPNLFTRFFRASNAIRNEVQGTGVGLFIAKAVVEQLNGHISVVSQVNEGATFEVWLPRRTEGQS